MHEVSIAEGIVDAVTKTAHRGNIRRVVSVRVAVGELAGVDCDALQFAWDSVTRGGLLKGARLVIDRPAGTAWCMDCAKTVPLHRHGEACPSCGGWHLTPVAGHELKVLDFEVPDERI